MGKNIENMLSNKKSNKQYMTEREEVGYGHTILTASDTNGAASDTILTASDTILIASDTILTASNTVWAASDTIAKHRNINYF